MRERRAVSLSIANSKDFLQMPATARLLYYDLVIRVTYSNGLMDNPQSIMRATGASQHDLEVLDAKGFVSMMDGGRIVIKTQ